MKNLGLLLILVTQTISAAYAARITGSIERQFFEGNSVSFYRFTIGGHRISGPDPRWANSDLMPPRIFVLPFWFNDTSNPFSTYPTGVATSDSNRWYGNFMYTGGLNLASEDTFSFLFDFGTADQINIQNNSNYNSIGPVENLVYTRFDIGYGGVSPFKGFVRLQRANRQCLICGAIEGSARMRATFQTIGREGEVALFGSAGTIRYDFDAQFIPDVPEPNTNLVLIILSVAMAIVVVRRRTTE